MGIYNISGNEIEAIYNGSGAYLSQAYDVDGNELVTADLTMMTYNVGQWYTGTGTRVPTADKSAYYALQSAIIDNNPVDVLFLQEYLSTWCQDDSPASELLGDYCDNQEVTNPQGYIGHSICTDNIAISNYTSHNFTNSSANYPTFESAEITVDGKTITLINTHNDYTLSYQQDEVSDLLDFLAGLDYFILAGDFNINLSTHNIRDNQYINSVKRFLDAGYNVANCVKGWLPTYYGTASPTGGKFTDQIVTSANIEIVGLYADTTKLTDGIADKIDHLPLIAKLRFVT